MLLQEATKVLVKAEKLNWQNQIEGRGLLGVFFCHFINIAYFRPVFRALSKQARKSSEDTHFTGYARFEKVWAG